MNENKITIIIVDDHPVVSEGLRFLLQKQENLQVVGCFTDAKETLDFMDSHSPDLVLLDISRPDMSGTDLCRKIKSRSPRTRVIAISNHSERSMVTQMLQNGASGYLLKNTSSVELVNSILSAVEGNLVLNDEVKSILSQGESSFKELPRLTRREKEILKMVAEGMTTASIGEKLFISPLTVETHRRNLMQKFEVSNSAALIKLAVENHLI